MCPRHDARSRRAFLAAQLALLCFALMAVPMRLYPAFHPDLVDGVRGAFLGIAIGSMILWSRRTGGRAA